MLVSNPQMTLFFHSFFYVFILSLSRLFGSQTKEYNESLLFSHIRYISLWVILEDENNL